MPCDCPSARTGHSLLESLFDSGVMLLVGRLSLILVATVTLACGLFVLGSIAVRVRRGHWLKRAGPFEVSETTAGDMSREIEKLELTVHEQRTRIVELEATLSSSAQVLALADPREDS